MLPVSRPITAGYLHGAWIDAAQEPWSIYDDVKAMLEASPIAGAEEWAIHDHEGFGEVRIDENAGFERMSALALFVEEHGDIATALLDYYSGDLDEACDALDDRYLGRHANFADYVRELTEAGTDIPEALRHYVDWQAMARDAELSGDVFTLSTSYDELHVFAAQLSIRGKRVRALSDRHLSVCAVRMDQFAREPYSASQEVKRRGWA